MTNIGLQIDRWPSNYFLLLKSMTVVNSLVQINLSSKCEATVLARLLSLQQNLLSKVRGFLFKINSKKDSTKLWVVLAVMLVKKTTRLKYLTLGSSRKKRNNAKDDHSLMPSKEKKLLLQFLDVPRVKPDSLDRVHVSHIELGLHHLYSADDLEYFATIAKTVSKTWTIHLGPKLLNKS